VAPVEAALTEALDERPGTVVCDLAMLEYLSPRVVRALMHYQATHPPIPPAVVVSGASGQVLRMLVAMDPLHVLPYFVTVQDAHDRLPARPRRAGLSLVADPEAPWRARAFAGGVCSQWALHTVVDDVVLLVSELVTNAVTHARTDASLLLTLAGGVLTIAVGDDSPTQPLVAARHRLAEGGRGMVLVERLAEDFGSYPQPDGGKVVWCTLPLAAAA
jgi:anti-sigma regulatory factor (Ser/Thr protein kinase)